MYLNPRSSRIQVPRPCSPHGLVPPIPSLFKTNKPPIASEVSAVRCAISKAESNLSDLYHQIGDAYNVLYDLEPKQIQEEQRLEILKGILHPIRRTPPELLATIFILALPEEWVLSDSEPYQSYLYRRAVLLPGQICSFWRDVALTTPHLWSKITLNLALDGKIYQTEINLVDTWLSRTGEYPLCIQIFHPGPEKTEVSHPMISSALVTSSSRWRYLLLSGSQSWLKDGALDGVRNRLSSLKTLIGRSATQIGSTDLFEHTPQLRSYEFRHRSFISPSSQCWAQLTVLTVEKSTVWECYRILSQAQNLITCSFHEIFETPDCALSRLCHPRLRSLAVMQCSNYDTILDHLTLPALSILQYREAWPSNLNMARSRSSVAAFLSQSMCSLNRLALEFGRPATGDDVLKILRLFPSLSELQLFGITTHEMLRRLTYDSLDSDSVVPALHTLELSRQKPISLLADMIESRMPQLKHVRVLLDTTIMLTEYRTTCMRLQKLRDEGLDIRTRKKCNNWDFI
jgi:hypothetical protein